MVLPDSTPVLSESYFSLSRNHPASQGVGEDGITTATHTSREISFLGTGSDAGRKGFRSMSGSGDGSAVFGPRMAESGYASVLGGWTGSGFGTASSMLESIVQIAHAGLSDNVRRESILHDLSKRPARSPSVSGPGGADSRDQSSQEDHGDAVHPPHPASTVVPEEEAGDPTLCCHCYAALLERIDEDCRSAERNALAYRDFIDVLDGIADDDHDDDSASSATEPGGAPDPASALDLETRTPSRRSVPEGSSDPGRLYRLE